MGKYASLLDKSIAESGLSLAELSKRCESSGVEVTISYISKLRNRKMSPPSFLITAVLAKSLDISPETLLAAGIYDRQMEDAQKIKKAIAFVSPNLNHGQLSERTRAVISCSQELLN